MLSVAAHDFKMGASEIVKRAAWGWARSAVLYEKTADDLERKGHSQKSLGLANIAKSE